MPAHVQPDEGRVRSVLTVLAALAGASGSHSPSVAQLERALPGMVDVDACFLANPYATAEVMARLRDIPATMLERMVAHYPSQAPVVARTLAPHLSVSPDHLHVANGASEIIQALLATTPGPVLLSVPTFSAYYEFADGPVMTHRLDHRDNFRLDLNELETLVERHRPSTVVIINPNNPDGGLLPHRELVGFVERLGGKVDQVIVDESFSHFTSETLPESLTPLVASMPHLVVINSLSKSHGIAGLRLGYAVMSVQRRRVLQSRTLWNLNAFAEWFCGLLADPEYQQAYEVSRKRYVRDTRQFFAELGTIPAATAYPSAANFALMRVDRPAREVTGTLLARHGVYVRDCADKRGLDGHFIRIAARSRSENERIIDGLRDVLVPVGI